MLTSGSSKKEVFPDSATSVKPLSLSAIHSGHDIAALIWWIYPSVFKAIKARRVSLIADHFSLNGYARKTNPYLEKEKLISFENVWSCGTSTALSVPCLFSIYNRNNYTKIKAESTENILDVLQRSGVNVLWLDNNSSSKGVAERIQYESYKTSDKNAICETECRDEGMLLNLQQYIDDHPSSDIFIVLHQMGNHGPAYYKRYPSEFEQFTLVCKSNQLEQCSSEEITNAYDNALLYTDYFLSKTISFLKERKNNFKASMMYISDHGESLGENGFYLHGLPYLFAPDNQKHVPLLMWFSEDEGSVTSANLEDNITLSEFSHDNVFHTVLGLLDVNTSIYEANMYILNHVK